jgi:metal-dependent amidase/aminoacylase/carboxypeptidase family protein
MEEDGFVLVANKGEECCSLMNPTPEQHQEGPAGYLSEIGTFIDSLAEALWPLNRFIHDNPEIAFQEYKAHQALTDFMRSRQETWKVTPSAYGMETAWVAVYDSGKPGPAVSFNVEMGTCP